MHRPRLHGVTENRGPVICLIWTQDINGDRIVPRKDVLGE
ncbi:MAG: hypothetical protein HW384_742 [Dehalococcoidia bacterium]|nr:hypothetical protein [Dehalococcoidia bacterium]